ncbi:MAG: flagellar biosynthesis protein [Clostridiales bacterium]|jgi:flagellar operon protein|nr:flagellar biosynthesis protein [Clostridiales bacterium]
MDSNVRFPNQPIQPSAPARQPAKQPIKTGTQPAFSQVWQQELQKGEAVMFSSHALQRLQTRSIELDAGDLAKINDAVAAAERKGARSSLLLYDDIAMVASIRNKTIITAMNGEELREHIFTNIDSAVIIK